MEFNILDGHGIVHIKSQKKLLLFGGVDDNMILHDQIREYHLNKEVETLKHALQN